GGFADGGESDGGYAIAAPYHGVGRNGQPRVLQHRVHDVLAQAERGGPRRVAGERNARRFERRDDRRLERRVAVNALAHVEDEVELAATQTIHPASIRVRGDARDGIALGLEDALDGLERLEDEDVGTLAQGGRAVKENGDLHATPPARGEGVARDAAKPPVRPVPGTDGRNPGEHRVSRSQPNAAARRER